MVVTSSLIVKNIHHLSYNFELTVPWFLVFPKAHMLSVFMLSPAVTIAVALLSGCNTNEAEEDGDPHLAAPQKR